MFFVFHESAGKNNDDNDNDNDNDNDKDKDNNNNNNNNNNNTNNNNNEMSLFHSIKIHKSQMLQTYDVDIEDITRWREDMNFIFEWQNKRK